jgi:hypothetical protein
MMAFGSGALFSWQARGQGHLVVVVLCPIPTHYSKMVAINPFFAPTASHFVIPSVGDKIDNATAQAQKTASQLKDQAYNRVQDLKETAKDSVSTNPTGIDLYARFALAGALGCAVTHGALTPVDVVKTRIQLEPEVYNRVSPGRDVGKKRALMGLGS